MLNQEALLETAKFILWCMNMWCNHCRPVDLGSLTGAEAVLRIAGHTVCDNEVEMTVTIDGVVYDYKELFAEEDEPFS